MPIRAFIRCINLLSFMYLTAWVRLSPLISMTAVRCSQSSNCMFSASYTPCCVWFLSDLCEHVKSVKVLFHSGVPRSCHGEGVRIELSSHQNVSTEATLTQFKPSKSSIITYSIYLVCTLCAPSNYGSNWWNGCFLTRMHRSRAFPNRSSASVRETESSQNERKIAWPVPLSLPVCSVWNRVWKNALQIWGHRNRARAE